MSNLIIYFSRANENYFSGETKIVEKGNTRHIVDIIRKHIDADLFEVIPKTDYPHDYLECTQVAKKELKNKTRPELEKTLTDISSYDVIYIGFPIWWGTLPMAMWTQLEELDFTGKIIKPFVTHEGSKFGKSLKDLKKLCKGADIKKGFEISGSNVENATCMVEIWLKE